MKILKYVKKIKGERGGFFYHEDHEGRKVVVK